MPEDTNAKAKAKVDNETFEPQIRELRKRAEAEAAAREENKQTQWLMPEKKDWDGDLFGIENLSEPFDRTAINEQFREATKDGEAPGVSGDLIVTTLQVDYLACMERAFRMRHTMRRPRAMAHMTARRKGDGTEFGVLAQCNLAVVTDFEKGSKV
jgi:hypothetical protein